MKIDAKDSRMEGLITLYDMHTDFLKRVLDGISTADAHNRFGTKANHMAWLTGSLVEQRYELVQIFGMEKKQRAHSLFEKHQGIRDDTTYPELSQFEEDWNAISPFLRVKLSEITSEKNDSMFDMGEMRMTYYELLSFMIYREANCIGQLALWRRLLNYPAMRYD